MGLTVLAQALNEPTLRHLKKRNEGICPHKTCTRISRDTLFIITKNYKQSKYTPPDEWITNCGLVNNGLLSNEKEWNLYTHNR